MLTVAFRELEIRIIIIILVEEEEEKCAGDHKNESNSSISQIFMSTTATAQLDYYINLLIKNCNFDCLNSGEREGERRERRLGECGLTKQ